MSESLPDSEMKTGPVFATSNDPILAINSARPINPDVRLRDRRATLHEYCAPLPQSRHDVLARNVLVMHPTRIGTCEGSTTFETIQRADAHSGCQKQQYPVEKRLVI